MKILGKLKYLGILLLIAAGVFGLSKAFPAKQAGVPLEKEVKALEVPAEIRITEEKLVQLTAGWKCPGPESNKPEFQPAEGIFAPAESWCFAPLSEQDLQGPVQVIREFPSCGAIEVELVSGRACVLAPAAYIFEEAVIEPGVAEVALVPTPTPVPTPIVPGESEPFPILPTIALCVVAIGGWKIAQRFIGKPRWVNPKPFATVDADRASITVDYFIEWQVTNIILYFIARLGGNMEDRLVAFANSACPQIFPNHTFDEQQGIVETLEELVTLKVVNRAKGLGIRAAVRIEGISLSKAAQEQRDIASAERRAGEGDKDYFAGLGLDLEKITPELIQTKIDAESRVEAATALGRGVGEALAAIISGVQRQRTSSRILPEEEGG